MRIRSTDIQMKLEVPDKEIHLTSFFFFFFLIKLIFDDKNKYEYILFVCLFVYFSGHLESIH